MQQSGWSRVWWLWVLLQQNCSSFQLTGCVSVPRGVLRLGLAQLAAQVESSEPGLLMALGPVALACSQGVTLLSDPDVCVTLLLDPDIHAQRGFILGVL